MKYSMLCCFIVLVFLSNAQTITGTVTNQNGDTLVGASIWHVKNGRTTPLAVSKIKGYSFSIKRDDGSAKIKNYDTLLCYYIGYKKRYEVISNNNTINFVLWEKDITNTTSFITIDISAKKAIVNEEVVAEKRRRDSIKARNNRGEEEEYNRFFNLYETPSEFAYGDNALRQYFHKAIESIMVDTIHSTFSTAIGREESYIRVGCTISKSGTAEKVIIIKGVDKTIDSLIIEIVKNMPKWKPAFQNGFNIAQYIEFSFPIRVLGPTIKIND